MVNQTSMHPGGGRVHLVENLDIKVTTSNSSRKWAYMRLVEHWGLEEVY